MVGYFFGIFMDFRKFIKKIRLKLFKYLVLKCFKSEIKENVMRKYYISYIVSTGIQSLPVYGDLFVDIDDKITEKAINDIKKKIMDAYNKQNNFSFNGSGCRVVIQEIFDVTKEENNNILNEVKENEAKNELGKDYFMPGTIETINGKTYIDGKEMEVVEIKET